MIHPEDEAYFLVKSSFLRDALVRAAIAAHRIRGLGQTAQQAAQLLHAQPQTSLQSAYDPRDPSVSPMGGSALTHAPMGVPLEGGLYS